jgi:hypothetical protein
LALLPPLRFFSERMRLFVGGAIRVCVLRWRRPLVGYWLAGRWICWTLDLVRALLALPNSDEKDEMMKPNCSQPRDEFSVSNQTPRVRGG